MNQAFENKVLNLVSCFLQHGVTSGQAMEYFTPNIIRETIKTLEKIEGIK